MENSENNAFEKTGEAWPEISQNLEAMLSGSNEQAAVWRAPNIDLDEAMARVSGPYIEVAGPSDPEYQTIDVKNLKKKLISSNLFPGAPRFYGNDFFYYGKVDFQADAQQMPIREGGVGAVFCSCLGEVGEEMRRTMGIDKNKYPTETGELRANAIHEAWRMIEPGGFLIWEGGTKKDLGLAESMGFQIVKLREEKTNIISRGGVLVPGFLIAAVFQKPQENHDAPSIKS